MRSATFTPLQRAKREQAGISGVLSLRTVKRAKARAPLLIFPRASIEAKPLTEFRGGGVNSESPFVKRIVISQ